MKSAGWLLAVALAGVPIQSLAGPPQILQQDSALKNVENAAPETTQSMPLLWGIDPKNLVASYHGDGLQIFLFAYPDRPQFSLLTVDSDGTWYLMCPFLSPAAEFGSSSAYVGQMGRLKASLFKIRMISPSLLALDKNPTLDIQTRSGDGSLTVTLERPSLEPNIRRVKVLPAADRAAYERFRALAKPLMPGSFQVRPLNPTLLLGDGLLSGPVARWIHPEWGLVGNSMILIEAGGAELMVDTDTAKLYYLLPPSLSRHYPRYRFLSGAFRMAMQNWASEVPEVISYTNSDRVPITLSKADYLEEFAQSSIHLLFRSLRKRGMTLGQIAYRDDVMYRALIVNQVSLDPALIKGLQSHVVFYLRKPLPDEDFQNLIHHFVGLLINWGIVNFQRQVVALPLQNTSLLELGRGYVLQGSLLGADLSIAIPKGGGAKEETSSPLTPASRWRTRQGSSISEPFHDGFSSPVLSFGSDSKVPLRSVSQVIKRFDGTQILLPPDGIWTQKRPPALEETSVDLAGARGTSDVFQESLFMETLRVIEAALRSALENTPLILERSLLQIRLKRGLERLLQILIPSLEAQEGPWYRANLSSLNLSLIQWLAQQGVSAPFWNVLLRAEDSPLDEVRGLAALRRRVNNIYLFDPFFRCDDPRNP
jgi:hypothetical protein